jgi:hypothetical protein
MCCKVGTASLQHDTIVDQKAPYDPAVLRLLPESTRYLLLESVDLCGITLPAAALHSCAVWGITQVTIVVRRLAMARSALEA